MCKSIIVPGRSALRIGDDRDRTSGETPLDAVPDLYRRKLTRSREFMCAVRLRDVPSPFLFGGARHCATSVYSVTHNEILRISRGLDTDVSLFRINDPSSCVAVERLSEHLFRSHVCFLSDLDHFPPIDHLSRDPCLRNNAYKSTNELHKLSSRQSKKGLVVTRSVNEISNALEFVSFRSNTSASHCMLVASLPSFSFFSFFFFFLNRDR